MQNKWNTLFYLLYQMKQKEILKSRFILHDVKDIEGF